MVQSALEIKDISKGFGPNWAREEIISKFSLSVQAGKLTVLVGPSGCGKSTLLRVMLGELEASSGSVLYAGRPSNERSRREVASEIAFVPQAESMAFPMTVRKLVEMGRYPHTGILGRMGSADREAVDLAMERAGVADLGGRSMGNLSGGERQRVRIARALAQQPKILVLDEPTAALDLHFAMETFELMSELTEEGSFTVVVATHNLNLAARYAALLERRLELVSDGQAVVRMNEPPEELLAQYANLLRDQMMESFTSDPITGPLEELDRKRIFHQSRATTSLEMTVVELIAIADLCAYHTAQLRPDLRDQLEQYHANLVFRIDSSMNILEQMVLLEQAVGYYIDLRLQTDEGGRT